MKKPNDEEGPTATAQSEDQDQHEEESDMNWDDGDDGKAVESDKEFDEQYYKQNCLEYKVTDKITKKIITDFVQNYKFFDVVLAPIIKL